MKSKITNMYLLTCLFAILMIAEDNAGVINVIKNFSFVIILALVQVFKDFIKINGIFFNVLELLMIMLFTSMEGIALEILVPIIFFEIYRGSFKNYFYLIIFSIIFFMIFGGYLINYIIFSSLSSLYLAEAQKQYIDNLELKRINKIQSAKGFMLQERMINMQRYLEQKDLVAALRERNNMAQKVHDHLGHRIISSIMQLEVTKETLGKDNETSKKYLLSAMDSLRCGMEEIRAMLKNIKPGEKVVSIEDIKQQLLKFQYDTNIKTHFEISGDVSKISISILTIINDNLKEALTNCAKYSNASNIRLSINIYNKFLRVEIKDDGFGAETINKNLGLKGMEERINSIGGQIQFYSNDGFVINMIINF